MKLSLGPAAAGTLAAGALLLVLGPAYSQSQRSSSSRRVQDLQAAGTGPVCADGVRDAANPSSCISASTVPTLGSLFPISEQLFVHPSTGFVGIGTTFPFRPLEVVGAIGSSVGGGGFKAVMRPSASEEFGVIETVSFVPNTPPPGGFGPTVTNLISTVSIDPYSGAMATIRDTQVLAAMTTPANDPGSGFVSVRNSNIEVAGINGGTGIVFGSAKAFVQPHPTDPTQEIQYVSLEGPEHGVYFRGTAQLVDGQAEIELPESFWLVAREEGLTVNLTPLGPNRGLYVARKGLAGIEVRENEGGSGDVSFDFLVMGVRSAMPEHVAIRENTHFAPAPGSTVAEGRLPGAYRELLIRNGTLNADGSVNEVSATGLGWRAEKGAWTGGRRASAELAER